MVLRTLRVESMASIPKSVCKRKPLAVTATAWKPRVGRVGALPRHAPVGAVAHQRLVGGRRHADARLFLVERLAAADRVRRRLELPPVGEDKDAAGALGSVEQSVQRHALTPAGGRAGGGQGACERGDHRRPVLGGRHGAGGGVPAASMWGGACENGGGEELESRTGEGEATTGKEGTRVTTGKK